MNIFVLDYDPQKAAEYHCDKHVVKMCLETAQLLCTAYAKHGEEAPYEPTHANHPCAIWAAQTITNYRWLWKLGIALCEEYTYRYDKVHSCHRVINMLRAGPLDLKAQGYTKHPQCMPDQYKAYDPIIAYRAYYKGEKLYMATWKKRQTPAWLRLR